MEIIQPTRNNIYWGKTEINDSNRQFLWLREWSKRVLIDFMLLFVSFITFKFRIHEKYNLSIYKILSPTKTICAHLVYVSYAGNAKRHNKHTNTSGTRWRFMTKKADGIMNTLYFDGSSYIIVDTILIILLLFPSLFLLFSPFQLKLPCWIRRVCLCFSVLVVLKKLCEWLYPIHLYSYSLRVRSINCSIHQISKSERERRR